MKINRNDNKIDTSLRELLLTASDLAFECSGDTKDADNFSGQAFVEILRDAFPRNKSSHRYFPGNKYLR